MAGTPIGSAVGEDEVQDKLASKPTGTSLCQYATSTGSAGFPRYHLDELNLTHTVYGFLSCGVISFFDLIVFAIYPTPPCRISLTRLTAAGVCFGFVLLTHRRKVSEVNFSYAVLICSVLWNALHSLGSTIVVLYEPEVVICGNYAHLFLTLMFAIYIGRMRERTLILAVGANVLISCAASMHIACSHMGDLGRFPWVKANIVLVALLLFIVQRQRLYLMLHSMQLELKAEKDAFESLLSMMCDAEFWVAADGRTIARSDHRFHALMQAEMLGSSLLEALAEEDRPRFAAAVGSTPDSKACRPVTLLPVTLLSPEVPPVKADLFIVDRRMAFVRAKQPQTKALGSEERLGFLVGLRLSDAAPEAAYGRAAAGRDAPDVDEHVLNLGEYSRSSSLGNVTERANSGEIPSNRCAPSSEPDNTPMMEQTFSDNSAPDTLVSTSIKALDVGASSRREFVLLVTKAAGLHSVPRFAATVQAVLGLLFESAQGGALVVVAPSSSYRRAFLDEAPSARQEEAAQPVIQSCDGGYMTKRMRHVHVASPKFAAAFREFTEYTESDRWPDNHPDVEARGQPKDGAWLLDTSGYRVKCAAKLLGLPTVRLWKGVGTKHAAAVACAWAVDNSVAMVRSSHGTVHGFFRRGHALVAYQLDQDGPITVWGQEPLMDSGASAAESGCSRLS